MKQVERPDASDAVLYLRVSSTSQLKTDYNPEGQSIPSQRTACMARAAELDAAVVEEFVDPGRSARSLEHRTEFREMITYVKANRNVRYVIVYSLSRFARNRYDDAVMMMRLERMGVRLVSVTERNLDDTPTGRAMHGMLAVFNQYQSDAQGVDIAYKMGQKVTERGGTLGGVAPIGYKKIRDTSEGREIRTMVIDDQLDRPALVRETMELYATGDYTIDTLLDVMIAKGLTFAASPTKPVRPITRSGLADLLRNRTYIGEVRYKGQWFPGRHETFIDTELFERVQRVLDKHSGAGVRTRRYQHYLKGIFWCKRCGHRMLYIKVTNRHGSQYEYYFCVGTKVAGCSQPTVRVDDLEDELLRYYHRVRLHDDYRQAVAQTLDEAMRDEQRNSVELEQRLKRQLAELDAQEDRYLELVGDPDWPQAKLKTKLAALRQRRTVIHKQRDELADTLDVGRQVLTEALELLRQPQQLFAQSDDAARRLLTLTIFGKLKIDTKKIVDHELQEPFSALVSVQQRHTERRHPRSYPRHTGVVDRSWDDWEHMRSSTFDELTSADLLDLALSGGQGLRKAALVELVQRYSKPSPIWRCVGCVTAIAEEASSREAPSTTRSRHPRHKLDQRLSTDLIAELVASYEAGTPTTELTGQYGLSKGAVLKLLSEAGVVMRRRPLTLEQVAEATRLYATGLSLVQVGEQLGCHPSTVHAAFKRIGIPRRPANRPPRRGRPPGF